MKYLDMAAELAAKVNWRDVYPNPRVGCVIVRDGEVLFTGVHEKCGGAHAEVSAIEKLNPGSNPGLEIYITLEPCDHFLGKKTGSCTDALLKLKPKKVVIGSIDARFGGKNVQKLRAAGIEVSVVSHEASQHLARVKPYVILKIAQSLDGKIGKGREKDIISSLESRKKVHQWRAEAGAILTTTGTVLADNPILDCRLLDNNIVQGLFVFGSSDIPETANVFQFPERKITRFTGKDLAHDLREISEMGVKTILTECGARMATSLLQAALVDEIRLFVAPRIFGQGVNVFSEEIDLSGFEQKEIEEVGGDILLTFVKKEKYFCAH